MFQSQITITAKSLSPFHKNSIHSLIESKFSVLVGLLKHEIEMTCFLILRLSEPEH